MRNQLGLGNEMVFLDINLSLGIKIGLHLMLTYISEMVLYKKTTNSCLKSILRLVRPEGISI